MRIQHVVLETTNRCNANCRFCTNFKIKNKGIMPDGLYRKIVDELGSFRESITSFTISGTGEPLLDPGIVDKLWYARHKLSFTEIALFTNGSYLDKVFERLTIPDFKLFVSINGNCPETRERLTGLKDYDHVVKYVDYARNMGIKVEPVIVMDGVSESERKAFIKRWGKAYTLNKLNFAGQFPGRTCKAICSRAVGYLSILWDGKVNLCCMDVPEQKVFGDINKDTIVNIWNKDSRQKYISKHLEGKRNELDLCKNCSHPLG